MNLKTINSMTKVKCICCDEFTEISITQTELDRVLDSRVEIEDALAHIPAEHRGLIKTGSCVKCAESVFFE